MLKRYNFSYESDIYQKLSIEMKKFINDFLIYIPKKELINLTYVFNEEENRLLYIEEPDTEVKEIYLLLDGNITTIEEYLEPYKWKRTIYEEGSVVGDIRELAFGKMRIADMIIEHNTLCVAIPYSIYEKYILKNTEALIFRGKILFNEINKSEHCKISIFDKTSDRLILYLYSFCIKNGNKGCILYESPETISLKLECSSRTIYRLLSVWKSDGLIDYWAFKIVLSNIQFEMLRQIANKILFSVKS